MPKDVRRTPGRGPAGAGGRKSPPGRTAPRRVQLPPRPLPTVPVWVPPVVYAAVAALLFREALLGSVSLLGMDSLGLSYFARDFYTDYVQAFRRFPHWNPLLFGGLPFVEGMHGDIFYPPSLALFFMDARTMWGVKMALHIFLAGIFAYLWLRRGLHLDRLPAFFGGLVFMMGANMVSLVLPGGDGKLFVAALAPLLFWLTERAVASGRAADFALFSLGLALMLFTSHMQAAYYCVWGVSLYFLFRVWQLWRVHGSAGAAARLVGTYALAGVLGVGAAAVQFLPPLAYLREHSHRVDRAATGETGRAWSASWSLNAEEIAALAVPEFVGELAQTSFDHEPAGYWGKNAAKMNSEYAGLVPLLLLPVLLLRRRTPQVWFFTGLAVLTLLYALAASTPLFHLFYLIPGVSLFRAWSMIIFLYGLAIATLGALAVQALLDWLAQPAAGEEQGSARRALWGGAAVLGVLAVLASAGVVMSLWVSLFGDGIRPDRLQANLSYIRTGFWIAFGIAAAVAAAWEAAVRGLLVPRALVLVLAVIAGVDLYRVGRPFVVQTALLNEHAAGSTLFQPDESIQVLQRLRDAGGVFRVADMSTLLGMQGPYGENDLAVHGLEQLAGHHGNEIGRYRALLGGERALNLLRSELRLADVTNTEYLLIPALLEDPGLEEVHVGAQTAIYRNRNVLPRAYLVGATEVVPGDAAIGRLLSEDFDPRTTAILAEPLPADVELQPGARGTVEWIERDVDGYRLRVAPDRPALLVVLDNHYPAWEATVNGRLTPIYRANHTFRAIAVPPGNHTVEFRYTPTALRTGALISLAVLALLLAVVTAGFLASGVRAPAAAGTPGAPGSPAFTDPA
jgi:hypothetical protein